MLGPISCIEGNAVEFEDGKRDCFDSLVFATGYKSTANIWLKVYAHVYQQSSICGKLLRTQYLGENYLRFINISCEAAN